MAIYRKTAGLCAGLAAALCLTGCGESGFSLSAVTDFLGITKCEAIESAGTAEEMYASASTGDEKRNDSASASGTEDTAQTSGGARTLIPQATMTSSQADNVPAADMQQVKVKIPDSYELDIPEVFQNPELPTGCESVALTMALMYEGYELEKTTIADDYLVYSYDGDFANGYVGDPKSVEGAGCFPPTIVETANSFLEEQNSDKKAMDASGQPFENLLQYVAANRPVLVWTTMYMLEPEYTDENFMIDGKKYYWYGLEHCVVLSGYDLDRGVVLINDPLDGIVERDLEEFRELYNETGKYAVVLM